MRGLVINEQLTYMARSADAPRTTRATVIFNFQHSGVLFNVGKDILNRNSEPRLL